MDYSHLSKVLAIDRRSLLVYEWWYWSLSGRTFLDLRGVLSSKEKWGTPLLCKSLATSTRSASMALSLRCQVVLVVSVCAPEGEVTPGTRCPRQVPVHRKIKASVDLPKIYIVETVSNIRHYDFKCSLICDRRLSRSCRKFVKPFSMVNR